MIISVQARGWGSIGFYMYMKKINFNSPIRKNIVANLFGIGVNLLNQIVLVPFYIVYWGNEMYSDWIVISALTAFFSMSDIGLNSVIQNRFSISYAQGDLRQCNSLLVNNIVIIIIIGGICVISSIVYVSFFDITEQLGLSTLTPMEGSVVFVVLLCQIFIQMFCGIENAIFRATHNASTAVYYDQAARLFIFVITFVCLVIGYNVAILCVAICLPNILLIAIKHINARKHFRWKFSLSLMDLKQLREILPQSVAYMSFPISNAILLQGFTLLVNRFWGSDTVVLYNTTRTMCNFIKTFLSTILNSVWPEFSIAYGKHDYATMRRLYSKAMKVSFVLAILISAFLLIAGPLIYTIWTHGAVQFSYPLITAFLVVLVVNTMWNTGCVALLATNNHVRFGIIDLCVTVAALTIAFFMADYFHSLQLVVYSMLVIDFPLIFYVNRKFKQLVTV